MKCSQDNADGAIDRLFYHLKKDFFPWVYYEHFVSGRWFGRNGWNRPKFN